MKNKCMIIIFFIMVLLWSDNRACFAAPPVPEPTITDYSSLPLFMSTSLLPNVMLIVDNSGSMLRFAYFDGWATDTETDDNLGKTVDTPCTEFNPAYTYYGYFDPYSWYSHSSSRFALSGTKSSLNPGSNPTNSWDGNFLNWLTMRRVDIIRKVLTGGRVVASGSENRLIVQAPDSSSRGRYKRIASAENYTPFSGTTTFDVYASGSTAIITVGGSSYDIKVVVGTTPKGILQAVGTNARWGLTYYNSDTGGYVAYSVTDRNMSTLTGSVLNSINITAPSTNTPLAETLWTVTGYFAQQTSMSISSIGPRYHPGDYTVNANNDPYNYGTGGQMLYATCAKSFVLLITDGEPCADGNLSDALKNYADGRSAYDCTAAAGAGEPCYIYPCSAGNYVPGIEDVALYAHTNDLRTETNMPNKQTLDLYTVFAFGAGSELMKYAAINGGFTDKNNNNRPDQQSEWDEDGDGQPDNYYVAADGYLLEQKLLAAINAIIKKVASGTTVAVLATSATGEGSLFQAYFEPSVIEGTRTVRWLGHLQGLWLDTMGNLREDTNNDGALVYTQDKIIKYVLDLDGTPKIEKYSDSDGDGSPDSETPYETVALNAATPIWEAGKLLAKKSASSRTIYTFKDSNGNGLPDTDEFIPFTAANASALQPYLRASDLTTAQNIINFIRGEQVTGYRDRQLTIDGVENQVWKLGDIVYSTPTVSGKPAGNFHITYGDTSYSAYYSKYKDREVIICTGANDGMLHAFWAGRYHSGDNPATGPQVEAGWFEDTSDTLNPGDEIWSYIPCNLLPHLKWLTASTYGDNTHVYYVDLKPRIADVKIFSADSDHPGGWGTVLIGGMRLGGGPIKGTGSLASRTFMSAYFALDITVPDQPKLLWEYTNADLGYTSSYPTVAKVGNKWFAVFGSGPTNLARGDCDNTGKNGKIFIVDIATGTASRIFTTPESGAFFTDPIAIDTQLDYSVDLMYIGETYDAGTTYGGKMYRLWTKDSSGAVQEDPNNWVNPSVLFDTTATGMSKPLTSSAAAAFDQQHNLWVYFGTGKFMGTTDKSDSYQQTFYGIKEPCSVATCTTTVGNNDTSLFNATNVGITEVSGTVTVSGVTGVSTWSQLLSTVGSYPGGWYYNLSTPIGAPSERVIYRPVVYGGVALFTTFTPNNDICGYGGNSSLYALNYLTGTANNAPVIGKSGDTILKKQDLGSGMASGVALHVVAAETGGASNDIEKAYIQMSTGVIVQADVTTELQKSGATSWRETR